MQVPKQVQANLDAALALEQAILSGSAAANDPPQPLTADPPAATVQAAPPASQAPAPQPSPPAEDFEQKYRTVLGKYNAEVPRMAQTIREAAAREDATKRRLDELEAELQRVKTAKPQEKPAANPNDVEEFGLDLVVMVQRQCEAQISSLMQIVEGKVIAFDARLTAIEQQVSGVSERTDTTLQGQFYATLEKLVPDWETTNRDTRFLAWLAEVDPIYGAPRQAALEAAHAALDVQRVANVFATFKNAHPAPKPPPSLENQVAPSSVAAPVPTAPESKPYITQAQVSAFYNARAQGRYRGKESEADAIEAQINLALAEGRVR